MTKFIVHLTINGIIETGDEARLPLTKDIGKHLKELRKAKMLTMKELSRLSEVSCSHIGRIERGERIPGSNIVGKLERVLGKENG